MRRVHVGGDADATPSAVGYGKPDLFLRLERLAQRVLIEDIAGSPAWLLRISGASCCRHSHRFARV